MRTVRGQTYLDSTERSVCAAVARGDLSDDLPAVKQYVSAKYAQDQESIQRIGVNLVQFIHEIGGQTMSTEDDDEHLGVSLARETNKEKAEVLAKLFACAPAAATRERALLNEYFATPESERRPPRSPLLHKLASEHLIDEPTLSESVLEVVDRE